MLFCLVILIFFPLASLLFFCYFYLLFCSFFVLSFFFSLFFSPIRFFKDFLSFFFVWFPFPLFSSTSFLLRHLFHSLTSLPHLPLERCLPAGLPQHYIYVISTSSLPPSSLLRPIPPSFSCLGASRLGLLIGLRTCTNCRNRSYNNVHGPLATA